MASAEAHRQAVQENRMVSVQEATVRKTVGCTLFALTTAWLYLRGPANVSGAALSFFYASAMTFLITGIFNQCGCSLRLRWAVNQKGRLFKDRTFTPPEHLQFIKGKRRGVLTNFAVSNIFSISLGSAIYSALGMMSQQRLNALILGSVCQITLMVFLSLRN